MPTLAVAIIDALVSLLEAEANSIFQFVGEGSPYLTGASPQIRQGLVEITHHLDQNTRELVEQIRRLGGAPITPPAEDAEEQYLPYLSLRFLLPKLVEAKKLMIRRYENALLAVQGNAEVVQTLERQLARMHVDLATLQRMEVQTSKPAQATGSST